MIIINMEMGNYKLECNLLENNFKIDIFFLILSKFIPCISLV